MKRDTRVITIGLFHSRASVIAEGNFKTMIRKLKRLFWLLIKSWSSKERKILVDKLREFFNRIYLMVGAPVAVRFNLDWPEAYSFKAGQLMRQYKKIFLCKTTYDYKLAKSLDSRIIRLLRRYVSYQPKPENISHWLMSTHNLFCMAVRYEDFKENLKICQKTETTRLQVLSRQQWNDLDVVFIPRNIALGSIGIYERLDAYIRACLLGLADNKKKVLLMPPEAKPNNPYYLKCWEQYVTVIRDPDLIDVLTPLEKALTLPIMLYLPLKEGPGLSDRMLGNIRERWLQERRKPFMSLSEEDKERGWNALHSLGVPKGAWFVGLHVRESGWHESTRSRWCHYRNANIDTYIPAIKNITAAGGWVVRLGEPSTKPLPAMPQVIDYAHSPLKSDWMDIFLCGQCRFFVGTSSGLWSIANAFGVPIVITNFLHANALYYFCSEDLVLPKICWSEAKKRNLVFSELLSPPVSMLDTQIHYDYHGLRIKDNSEEEIAEVVQEMLDRLEGRAQYNQKDEDRQRQFKAIAKKCSALYGDANDMHARVGKSFLRDYEELLR